MSKPRFRLFATTADVGLLVWGGSREELYRNAAAGLYRIIAPNAAVAGKVQRVVRAEGRDEGERLVAWLGEWLYLFETEGFIGTRFSVESMEGSSVSGCGWGVIYDPKRHRLGSEVKGITYHGLEIRRRGNGLRARLILDV